MDPMSIPVHHEASSTYLMVTVAELTHGHGTARLETAPAPALWRHRKVLEESVGRDSCLDPFSSPVMGDYTTLLDVASVLEPPGMELIGAPADGWDSESYLVNMWRIGKLPAPVGTATRGRHRSSQIRNPMGMS
jgi:hypothetical protein